jgi:hypothetical protein
MIDGVRENFQAIGESDIFTQAKVTADSGFHNEANMRMLSEKGIDGYVADNMFRKRDPKFVATGRGAPRRAGKSDMGEPQQVVGAH